MARRVVRCVQVEPGAAIPAEEEADIWWDQLHNRSHMTFLDPRDWVPTSARLLRPGKKRVPAPPAASLLPACLPRLPV